MIISISCKPIKDMLSYFKKGGIGVILVNKGNFSVYTVQKMHNSVSASKNTFYADFKICLALEGEALWEIEDRIYRIQPGDIVFLNIGQKRQFTAFGKEGFKLCAFTMSRDAFFGQHHFMFFLHRTKHHGNVIRNHLLSPLLAEIYTEWETNAPLRYELASAKLTEFFLKAERQENYTSHPISENHRRILEIMDYIDANIANDISLQTVAKKAGLTQSTLSRQFSRINGISFKQYVVEKKIQRAILLLQTTNRTMIDISLDCGFDSISGFYSAFRKKTGTTPSKFSENEL